MATGSTRAAQSVRERTALRQNTMWKAIAILVVVWELLNSLQYRDGLVGDTHSMTIPTCESPAEVDHLTHEEEMIPRNAWCPKASCVNGTSFSASGPNSLECDLCEQKFLIILTQGRTASTTLTWTLDALPGIRMGGENNGAINQYMQMMDRTVFDIRFDGTSDVRNKPWGHARVKTNQLHCATQQYFRALYPPWADQISSGLKDVIGFKTIYLHEAKKSDEQLIRFLDATFPCARYIANIRSDLGALVQSHQKNLHKRKYSEENAEQGKNRLMRIAEKLGSDRAYLLDSTEWTTNITKINEFVRWLGFSAQCDFEEVLELNTENGGYGNGKVTLEHFNPNCKYLGMPQTND